MAQYRIVCTKQEPIGQPTTHTHIIAVGTGPHPGSQDIHWSLAQVLAAMDRGDIFYTQGERSGKVAAVQKDVCGQCRTFYTIRSAPDAVTDNNLDSLRHCPPKR